MIRVREDKQDRAGTEIENEIKKINEIFLWCCRHSLNHSLWSLHPFKQWHMRQKCAAEKQPVMRSVALTFYWSCPSPRPFFFPPFCFENLNLFIHQSLLFLGLFLPDWKIQQERKRSTHYGQLIHRRELSKINKQTNQRRWGLDVRCFWIRHKVKLRWQIVLHTWICFDLSELR